MATGALLPQALTRARLAQGLTIGWMLIEAAVAIGAAVMARSVALGAFGADSVIELLSAGVVLRQLLDRTALDEGHVLSAAVATLSTPEVPRKPKASVGEATVQSTLMLLVAAAIGVAYRSRGEKSGSTDHSRRSCCRRRVS